VCIYISIYVCACIYMYIGARDAGPIRAVGPLVP
jgi:hypothetical protein